MDEDLRRLEVELKAGYGNREEFFLRTGRYSPKEARDAYFKYFRGITVPITILEQDLAHFLSSAFEGGGTNHWATIVDYVYPPGFSPKHFKSGGLFNPKSNSAHRPGLKWHFGGPEYIMLPLLPGGAIILRDGATKEDYRLDRESLARGLKLMEENHLNAFSALLKHDYDTFTADLLVQCSTLGDQVYG